MNVLITPRCYENDISLKDAGSYIKKIGTKVLVLAGRTAYKKAGDILQESMKKERIVYDVSIVEGYPTAEKVEYYGRIAKENAYDALIAVGGGRIMDLTKAAAEYAGLPVITIPTVAATCAAWSTLSVLYTEDGAEDAYVFRKESPATILVDKKILLEAPERYLFAGVADAMVKWYEISSNYNENRYDFPLRLQIKVSELITECLEHDFVQAYLEKGKEMPRTIKSNAIDAIIMLAGLTGSINGSVPYGGLAHHFYNQATHIKDTHICLHGEIVIFGLFMQLVVENYNAEDIKDRMKSMQQLGMPITLDDLGISNGVENAVRYIAKTVAEHVPDYAPIGRGLAPEIIERAIYRVDEIGRRIINENVK